MANSDLRVTFWGVRGSFPVPGPGTLKIGGNTTCVEVRAGPRLIILDAGTGLIPLGERLAAGVEPVSATILLSHVHTDHTAGFPFFRPAHDPRSRLHVYGPETFDASLKDLLTLSMLPPVFPVALDEMPSLKHIHGLRQGEAVVFAPGIEDPTLAAECGLAAGVAGQETVVRVLRSNAHPQGGVFVYRIEHGGRSLVFATDVEGYVGGDQRLIAFARGADLLIHDAQYLADEYAGGAAPRQGWGHSTPEMACDVARQALVRRLVLTHHDPARDDAGVAAIETFARSLFDDCRCAREGMTLTV